MLEYQELLERLKNEDELTIMDLLNITSEELVEAFRGKIRQRRKELESYLDDTITEEEEDFSEEVDRAWGNYSSSFDSDYE